MTAVRRPLSSIESFSMVASVKLTTVSPLDWPVDVESQEDLLIVSLVVSVLLAWLFFRIAVRSATKIVLKTLENERKKKS